MVPGDGRSILRGHGSLEGRVDRAEGRGGRGGLPDGVSSSGYDSRRILWGMTALLVASPGHPNGFLAAGWVLGRPGTRIFRRGVPIDGAGTLLPGLRVVHCRVAACLEDGVGSQNDLICAYHPETAVGPSAL